MQTNITLKDLLTISELAEVNRDSPYLREYKYIEVMKIPLDALSELGLTILPNRGPNNEFDRAKLASVVLFDRIKRLSELKQRFQ